MNKPNWTELRPRVDAHFAEKIKPVLDEHGATGYINYDESDYWWMNMLTVEFKGETFSVNASVFERVKPLEWFLTNFDAVKAIAARFTDGKWTDPFHSDIYRFFRDKWGERKGQRPIDNSKNPVQMGIDYVCNVVHATGGRVHSD